MAQSFAENEYSPRYLDWASSEFAAYIAVKSRELGDQAAEYTHLQDYLMLWLEHGSAIECSGGRFDTYMRIVVRIIDLWQQDPTVDGAIQQPVMGILDLERDSCWAVDPDYFARRALLRQLGRSQPD